MRNERLDASKLMQPDNNSNDAQVFQAVNEGLLDFCVTSPEPDVCEIEKYIQEPDYIDTAAFAAAYLGKTKLRNFFLEHLAHKHVAVQGAIQAGNQSLADELISTSTSTEEKNLLKIVAVQEAAYVRNDDLVIHLLNVYRINICFAVTGAILANNLSLMDDLIDRGADKDDAVFDAARAGKRDLVDYLLIIHRADIDYAIAGARFVKNETLLSFLEKQRQDKLGLKSSDRTSWWSMFASRRSIASQEALSEETRHAGTASQNAFYRK